MYVYFKFVVIIRSIRTKNLRDILSNFEDFLLFVQLMYEQGLYNADVDGMKI